VPRAQKCPAAHGSGGLAAPPVPDGHAQPGGHGAHAAGELALTPSSSVPAGHSYCRPPTQKWPGAQGASGADSPLRVHSAPASHALQLVTSAKPPAPPYVSGGHGTGAAAAAGQYAERGQGAHVEASVAPTAPEKVPPAHGCCPAKRVPGGQKWPAGHGTGAAAAGGQ
jgi:hypothetical protein